MSKLRPLFAVGLAVVLVVSVVAVPVAAGGDDHDDCDGDTDQHSQQSNDDDGTTDTDAADGNSVTVAVASENTTLGDSGDSGNQVDENDQEAECDGDVDQHSQQSNSDDDVLDADAANGNSVVIAILAEDTRSSDGGDTGNQRNHNDQQADCDGETDQHSQQSNSDDDVLDVDAANGNSVAVGVLSSDTESGDGGDTGTQRNTNSQHANRGCDGDADQHSQQSNSDDDVLDADLLNGGSLALGVLSDNTTAGDGGDTGSQQNRNVQHAHGGCDGDADQHSQQSDDNDDLLRVDQLNGASLALGLLDDDDTTAGDGGDTGSQQNESDQVCN